jgi:thioesterase domain-containing protein
MAATDISANASFFALGGHSLLVMKLVQQIDQVFRTRGIAISTVVQAPTLARMAAAINSHNQLSWQPLTLLSPDAAPGCVTEVYLAPGAGMTSGGYLDLAAAMPQVQFICLEPAGSHDSTSAIDDWEQLISTYADAVLARQPAAGARRLIHLLGHSSGGAVAFALAARLESSGCNVRLILCECLIATSAAPQFRISAAQKTELMQAYARELKPDASAAQIHSWLELPLTRQLFEVYFRQVDWAESYRPAQVLNASTYLLLTPEQPTSYWQAAIDAMQPYLSQPVQVIKTDGEHVSMIKSPHVRTLAARLGAVLGGPTQGEAL